ncbi:oxidoreductase [Marinobacter zhanjiangensis]|uniref:Flagellin modification protein A n=1 Tax=Marinobacter zhanjiangensis TaxID=578215 RepID=A0ABQ3B3B5_9GAMM|nr:oxidoreductase [Marinobacter zhanjiangensis]GGY76455.1 flagellin modification protein A [Marinobacter zhanjiangensis]
MTLEGKVVLVAGAGGLLGRAIVKSVCEEGGKVIAADIDEETLSSWIKEAGFTGDQVIGSTLDITEADSINAAFDLGREKWGQVNAAVNTSYPRNKNYGKKFFDVAYADFCENVSLHLGGYFLFMQQCAKEAMTQGIPFSLVNLSSIYGVIAPKFSVYEDTEMTMPVEYAAIKSGLLHLNRYLTAEMKGTGFRVNSVSPGGILAGQPESFLEKYKSHCSSKGMLDVDDVVGSVNFLLSDKSKYVSGQNLIVDDAFSV